MSKKGPLSKAEKFYIENHIDLDIRELCKDLDRAQDSVNRFIKTLPKDKRTVNTQGAKSGTLLSEQFARNSNGATIMTPNASIMSDDKRSQFNNGKTRSKKCITQIIQD